MALAGETLFVAGPRSASDFRSPSPADDVWLWAVSAEKGTRQTAHSLPAAPVFDSFAVCETGLYFTTVDGQILCYQPKK